MIRFYRLAVEAEHKRALNNLGVCYIQGNGVPVDIEKGIALLLQSKQGGDCLGAKNYNTLTANEGIAGRRLTFAYGGN
jgi:TPR repeat protein